MASAKKKTKHSEEEYVFMENTRALLSDVWDHWVKGLGHTPAVAQKKMTAAIREFHKVEAKGKKAKSKVKAKVNKLVKKVVKKTSAKKKK